MRFDPETPALREEAVAALRWGTVADRSNREAVLPMSPVVLERGRNKLLKQGMKVRRGPDGLEWLLYRGEGRCDLSAKFNNRTSWSPYVRSSQRFAREAFQKHESCPHRTAAWVPERAVVSIPFMYGSESKAWGGDKKGKFAYREEREVIADPFTPREQATAPYSPDFDEARRRFESAIGEEIEERSAENSQRVIRLRTKALEAAKSTLDRALISDLDNLRSRR